MAQLYVAVNKATGHRVDLHTDPECSTLARSETREVSRETHPNRDLCPVCAGGEGAGGDQHERGEFPCDHCNHKPFQTRHGRDRHILREHRDVVEAALNGGEVPA